MRTAQENIADLPHMCYGKLASNNSVILIIAGQSGYKAQGGHLAKPPEDILNGRTIDEYINEGNLYDFKCSIQQRMAMEWGSMFGWGHGQADHNNYDEKGKPYCERNPRPVKQ